MGWVVIRSPCVEPGFCLAATTRYKVVVRITYIDWATSQENKGVAIAQSVVKMIGRYDRDARGV